jgi:hypothetical protein
MVAGVAGVTQACHLTPDRCRSRSRLIARRAALGWFRVGVRRLPDSGVNATMLWCLLLQQRVWSVIRIGPWGPQMMRARFSSVLAARLTPSSSSRSRNRSGVQSVRRPTPETNHLTKRSRPGTDRRERERPPAAGSAAGDEGDDDVGGVAVEVLAAPVVDRGGARIGVTRCGLHVP